MCNYRLRPSADRYAVKHLQRVAQCGPLRGIVEDAPDGCFPVIKRIGEQLCDGTLHVG